jgi:hypothetical protein
MIDGNVRGTLIKIGCGITTCPHEGRDQLIGSRDRTLRMINKAGLDGVPVCYVAFPLRGAKLADLQAFHPRLTIRQFCLGLVSGSVFENSPVVFWSKALP